MKELYGEIHYMYDCTIFSFLFFYTSYVDLSLHCGFIYCNTFGQKKKTGETGLFQIVFLFLSNLCVQALNPI